MTIAIPLRPVPPSIELGLDETLEAELLDAAHAVIAPHADPGSLIVRVISGTERAPGLVHVLFVDPKAAPDGLNILSLRVVHLGPRTMTQVIATCLELPEDKRSKGIGRALIEALFNACASRGAALLLTNLTDIGTARLIKRGAHRIEPGVVQIIAKTKFS